MRKPYTVGVTGGIGSGKSTVCAEFEKFGIGVVDADQVAREVVVPGTPGLAAIVAEFGSAMLEASGHLDRAALRRVVFSDESRRLRLETILHPLIRARLSELLSGVASPYCLLGIPLLVEKGNHHQLNRVLVVDCPVETQISRVVERDHLTVREAEAIIRAQATREQRLAVADDIISNATDIDSVKSQVERLHVAYLAHAENYRRAQY